MGKQRLLPVFIAMACLLATAANGQKTALSPAPGACFAPRMVRLKPAPLVLSPVFLPKWSAEDLPFFCKIEHRWTQKNGRIPVKFRLGSVEYVDWLEGKSKW